ncbi:MAG: hypothetical protein HKL90_12890 [Elusimicrobia bacterium]|nr:hypothetical protein [Elusimicrobiota bacterium]
MKTKITGLRRSLAAALPAALLAGCTSIGTLGLVTKSEINPAQILDSGRPFKDMGPAEGSACKYIFLSIIPWGRSDLELAVERALKRSSGDALVNVTVASSLYSFLPIYNILTVSCTAVKGDAIEFTSGKKPETIPR